MASTSSNIGDHEAYLMDLADAIDLSAGPGDDALDLVAERIADRTIGGQVQPDGTPLKELTDAYKRRKVARGQPDLVGVATGETLSIDQLKGERTITPTAAEMTYGKAETAREKAGYLTANGREFYAMTAEDEAAVEAFFADHLAGLLGA